MSSHSSPPVQNIVVSYLQLRRAIGYTGLTLGPLLIGFFFFLHPDCPLPPSISHFYYTSLGTYFTGSLIAIALFLFFYSGPEAVDRATARMASACACVVAFCPTSPYCPSCLSCQTIKMIPNYFQTLLHYSAAIFLFLLLAYFCLFLFTRTHPHHPPTAEKLRRNRVYRCCGWVILLSLLGMAFVEFNWLPFQLSVYHPILVGETIALSVFGISWLVKGAVFLHDK